jgi:catechol 2,3-dioxygenase-like lactoylglutathione lyase family enzyme
MRIPLGQVGHFGLAVENPETSARWWSANFDLDQIFRSEGVVGMSNDAFTIVLRAGMPNPTTIGHMSFHLADMTALRTALDSLRENGVDLEDPGDEIGPEVPGSKHMGLWFHDPDGYRWELSVQNGSEESRSRG